MSNKTISLQANVKSLLRALYVLNKVVMNNPVLPVLENVLLCGVSNDLTSVVGSNMVLFVKMNLAPGELPIGSSKVLVPFAKLFRLVRKTRSESIKIVFNDMGIETSSVRVTISCDEGDFYVAADDSVGDFPKIPSFKAVGNIAMLSHQLKEGLRVVESSICHDDLRPAMTMVYATEHDGCLRMVATDGHCLTAYDSNTSYSGPSFFIHRKVSMLLSSMRFTKKSYAHISVGDSHVSIGDDEMEISWKFHEKVFPDYMNALPNGPHLNGAIDVTELKRRLAFSELFALSYTHQGVFTFQNNSLEISTEDSDFNSGSLQIIPCEFEDTDKFIIGFNVVKMKQLFRDCDGRVSFNLYAPNKAAIFLSTPKYGLKITSLLMPVMLSTYI